MKKMIWIAVIFAITACDWFGEDHFGGHPRSEDGDGNKKPTQNEEDLIVSAVSFPSDYDWKKDSAYTFVSGANLLLLKGKDTVCIIPCQKERFTRTDSDMHHILNGHLITEYAGNNETVISRDGEILFRYAGNERLKGLSYQNDCLYSLGQDRSGEGFSLRKEGQVQFSRNDGVIIGDFNEMGYSPDGALYWDNGKGPYFSFWTKESGSDNKEWYLYDNGKADKLELPKGCDTLLDVRIIRGELYFISASGGLPALFRDNCLERTLSIEGNPSNDYKIALIGGEVCVYGTYIRESIGHRRDSEIEKECSAIWYSDGKVKVFNGQGWIYPSADSIGFIRTNAIPKGYSAFNYWCGYFNGDDLYLALSPKADTLSPCLYFKGKGLEYDINGFLSGISVSD